MRKFWFCAVLSICALVANPLQAADENRYDVFLKAFAPLLQVLCEQNGQQQHALMAEIHLVQMTGAPDELLGTSAQIALQFPDKALLRVHPKAAASGTGAPLFGPEDSVTLARIGQELQITPGAKVEALLPALGELPKPKKKYQFAPLALPFKPKQLALLPALFEIQDANRTDAGDRVLDVRLMPELAKGMGIEEWAAKVTISADYRPKHIEIFRPDWRIAFDVDQVSYAKSLPPATWDLGQKDVLRLSPPKARQIFEALQDRGKQLIKR